MNILIIYTLRKLFMKKGFYSIGSIIILLLAAITFVLVPAISEKASGFTYPDYGSYNGRAIRFDEQSDFYKEANYIISQYEQNGVDFNSEESKFYYSYIFNQAFQRVVLKYSLEDFSKSIGYNVPKGTLIKFLKLQNVFKDQSGEYSEAIYKNATAAQKKEIYDALTTKLNCFRSEQDLYGSNELINNEPLFGLKKSSSEIDFIKKMSKKVQSFEVASFNLSNYPDSEKVAFGNAHKDIFKKLNLKVISCDSKEKANEVLKRIKNSEITFEDAITEYSTNYYGDEETGIIGASYKYQISNAVVNPGDEEKITSLAKDQYTDVIETPSAYCIFKSFDDPIEADFTDSKTISDVYEYLLTREKSIIEDYFTNLAKDFTAKAISTSFDQACSEFNVTKSDIPQVALNYGNETLIGKSFDQTDSIMNYVSTNDNFFKTAFKLKKDEISSPIVLSGSNKVIVLKCTGISELDLSNEESTNLISSELRNATNNSIRRAILTNDKVVDNSSEFMAAFNQE